MLLGWSFDGERSNTVQLGRSSEIMDHTSWSVCYGPRVDFRCCSHALTTGIIISVTQILSIGLRKLRQPRVIAEVLGGILLGATPGLHGVSIC